MVFKEKPGNKGTVKNADTEEWIEKIKYEKNQCSKHPIYYKQMV